MAVDTSLVGQVTGRRVVVVERGPVAAFAQAVQDQNRVYRDREAALAAGFDAIPTPPTFPFVMGFWGSFRDLQNSLDPVPTNPVRQIMDGLGPGLSLHAEQEFRYDRPIVVGDVLYGEDVLSDLYEKHTDSLLMTFMVTTTEWWDYADQVRGGRVATTRFCLVHRARRRRTAV